MGYALGAFRWLGKGQAPPSRVCGGWGADPGGAVCFSSTGEATRDFPARGGPSLSMRMWPRLSDHNRGARREVSIPHSPFVKGNGGFSSCLSPPREKGSEVSGMYPIDLSGKSG